MFLSLGMFSPVGRSQRSHVLLFARLGVRRSQPHGRGDGKQSIRCRSADTLKPFDRKSNSFQPNGESPTRVFRGPATTKSDDPRSRSHPRFTVGPFVPQLFSDPGKKGNPFWGRPFLVGQPPKKQEKEKGWVPPNTGVTIQGVVALSAGHHPRSCNTSQLVSPLVPLA